MEIRDQLEAWVRAYIQAWNSNDPGDIRALFTPDARYLTEPHARPWSGHEEIVREWLDRKDGPEDHTFRWEIMATDGDLGFVRGWTTYTEHDPPREYGNLWVVRLAEDGRAREYTEWWVLVRRDSPPFPD